MATTPSRKGALAAGAARATGERSRRRSTPLIGLAPQPPVDPSAVASPEQPVAPAAPAPGGTGKASPAAKASPRHTAGKHRPAPEVTSEPTRKARVQAGVREEGGRARPRRMSPRRKRELDEAARSRLRLAPEPGTTPPEREPRAAASGAGSSRPRPQAAPDPTTHPQDDGFTLPGLDDVLATVLQTATSLLEVAGYTPEEVLAFGMQVAAFVQRRRTGDFEVDEFGFDRDFAENILFPVLRPLAEKWFRVEVRGIENIPVDGPALVVANHSGTVAIDSLITQLVLHDHHPRRRIMRSLGADLVFQTPFLGSIARWGGATLATNADAERLFERGELVGVWPEGFKGVGKPFTERYRLQRFGRGGFVQAALKGRVPIIPTSIVGAEEIAPIIGNMPTIARLLGLPYAPITPTFPWLGPLGLIPLPSKWIIEFGEPIHTEEYGPDAADDPMLVFDLTDQVREQIQQSLHDLLATRRSVFF